MSGVDVTDPETVSALLDEVDRSIGSDRLRALHVNDADAPLGSNRDRHANLGAGLMGEGLAGFLADPRLQELPAAILETPGPDGHIRRETDRRASEAPRRSYGALCPGTPRQPMTVLL